MMSEETNDSIVKRLESLKRENRRMKRAGAAALVGITAVVLLGQAVPPEGTKVDEDAKPRATLRLWPDGVPRLALNDQAGNVIWSAP